MISTRSPAWRFSGLFLWRYERLRKLGFSVSGSRDMARATIDEGWSGTRFARALVGLEERLIFAFSDGIEDTIREAVKRDMEREKGATDGAMGSLP